MNERYGTMADMASDGSTVRWRPTMFAQVTGYGCAAVMCGAAVYTAANPGWGLPRLGFAAFFLFVGGVFVFMVSAHVDLYPDRVVLAGPLRRRREIALAQLSAVEAGRNGLFFRTGLAQGVFGPASVGGKNLGLQFLRHQSRGDRIATTIMRHAVQLPETAAHKQRR